MEVTSPCDLPSAKVIKSFAAPDLNDCQLRCERSPECLAFQFISGWNRCFIKENAHKRVPLRIYSAAVAAGTNSGTRTIGSPVADTDIPGKDLRKIEGLTDPDACGKACLKESQCVAYSFLDAYRLCWLKNRLSAQVPKVFSCGARVGSEPGKVK